MTFKQSYRQTLYDPVDSILSKLPLLLLKLNDFLLLPSGLNKTVLLITHPAKYYFVKCKLIAQ